MFPDIPPKGGAMGASDLFNDHRLTGGLLILAFISFASVGRYR
jgi:hypothetical protein